MNKGELLGKGMTAEVYAWGQDKVLKLYLENYREEWIRREADIGQRIHDAGVPSPAVYDMVEVDGRKGVIFQRIYGKTVVGLLASRPYLFCDYVFQMAGFHYKIHQYSADGIPSQKERLSSLIRLSSDLLGSYKVKRILNYLDRLPEGNSICHGDFYLSNIIISDNQFVAIDWSGGCIGNPLGDVVKTCMIINSPAMLPGTPGFLAEMSRYPKWLTYQIYINEYMRLARAKFSDLDAWVLPVAAARLKERIPGEERWLMKMINKRLSIL